MIRFGDRKAVLAGVQPELTLHEQYHQGSKLGPVVEAHKPYQPASASERIAPLEPPKQYPSDRAAHRFVIDPTEPLGPGRSGPESSLGNAIGRRRSSRAFAPVAVDLDTMGWLLAGSYHVSGRLRTSAGEVPLRTVPSAGALYPVEVYLVAARIDGLPAGAYHYDPVTLRLAVIRLDEQMARRVRQICSGQPYAEQAAGAIFLAPRFQRCNAKYGERGYRYALLEAGHIAQAFCLGAATLELAMLCQGAFYDDLANQLLQLDGVMESVVYVLLFGRCLTPGS